MDEPSHEQFAANDPSTGPSADLVTRLSGLRVEPTQWPVLGASDRYSFGPVFASGGLGTIRRAFDRRLRRAVAVKELRQFIKGNVGEQRFLREALIVARLEHPAIVPIHDIGLHASGEPYFCMKLVDGTSLQDLIRATLRLADRVALLPHVVAVADAIAYAHDRGVIHRDLKPANVLVGAFGETVVIDWGLAKELHAQDEDPLEPSALDTDDVSEAGDLTHTGEFVGTLAFMPPEQALGTDGDTRADIYAIGAILYHVLARRAPYEDTSPADRLSALLAGPPIDLTRIVPDVSADLLAIVRKAMARDPNARYASTKQLAADLRRFQEGRLVAARTYSSRELLGHFVSRQRTILRLAAISSLLLAFLGIYSYAQISAQRRIADAQRAQAVDAQRAEATMRSLADVRARDNQRIAVEQLRETAARDLFERHEPQHARVALTQALRLDSSRGDLRRMLHEAAAHADNLRFELPGVAGFRYASSGDRIVTWHDDGSVVVRNSRSGAEDYRIAVTGPPSWAMFVPGADDRIVIASADGIRRYTRGSLDWQLGPEIFRLAFVVLAVHGTKALLAGDEGGMILDMERGTMVFVPSVALGRHDPAMRPPDSLFAGHSDHLKATWQGASVLVTAPEDDDQNTTTPWPSRLARIDADGERSRRDVRFVRNPTHSLVFSPDSRTFTYITGSTAMLADAASGRERHLEACGDISIARARPPEPTAAFTPDGAALLRLLGDGRIARWNTKTAKCEASRADLDVQYDRLAVTHDGDSVVLVGKHGLIRVLDSRTLAQRGQFLADTRPIHNFAVHPREAQIAALNTDGVLRLWSLGDPRQIAASAPVSAPTPAEGPSNDELHHLAGLRGIPSAEARDFSGIRMVQDDKSSDPGARELLRAGNGCRTNLLLVNAWNGTELARLWGNLGNFSHDGRLVFTSFAGDGLKLYDTASGAEFGELVHPTDTTDYTSSKIEAVTLSPDRQLFAFADTLGPITVWDADTLEQRGVLHGHMDEATDLHFSTSSDYLLSIADEQNSDGQVFLWDVDAMHGRRIMVSGVTAVAFAPDDEVVAIGTRQGVVQLYDLSTGAQVNELRGHSQPVTHIEHADGDRLITTAAGERTITWQLGKSPRPGAELE